LTSSVLIQKVWNFRHTLRDDDVDYGDYLEQLTSFICCFSNWPMNIPGVLLERVCAELEARAAVSVHRRGKKTTEDSDGSKMKNNKTGGKR